MLFFLPKQKMRARRLPRDELNSLCRELGSAHYNGQIQPQLQRFHLPTIPEVVKLATKLISSALGLCFTREITVN